jgi:hypothetical protein
MLTQRALDLRSTLDNTLGSEERIRYIDALLSEMFDNCKPTPEEFDTVFDGLDLTEKQKAGMVSIIDYGSEAVPESEVAEEPELAQTVDGLPDQTIEIMGLATEEEIAEAFGEVEEFTGELAEALEAQAALEPIVIPEVTELVAVEAN